MDCTNSIRLRCLHVTRRGSSNSTSTFRKQARSSSLRRPLGSGRSMVRLTELLAKRKWQKRCLRTNIAAPQDIQQSGKVRKLLSPRTVKEEGAGALRSFPGSSSGVVGGCENHGKQRCCGLETSRWKCGTLVDSVARGLHGRRAELRRWGESRKERCVAQDRR